MMPASTLIEFQIFKPQGLNIQNWMTAFWAVHRTKLRKFPKTKQITLRAKVVCPGVAAEHGLRVSGRQNALGSILSRRRSAWCTGTMSIFAAVFESNTHTGPNFRVPLTAKTHDSSCAKACE